MKPEIACRMKMVKIRVKINETENGKTIEKNQQNQSWFFEKISKIDNPFMRLGAINREHYYQPYTNVRIIREYYEQLFANKLDK